MEKHQKYILMAMVMLVFMSVFGILGEKASCATQAEIEQWLQAHNYYRALHGSPAVTWSDTVAASAQAWADTCPSVHSSSGYGENLAWASYALTPQGAVDLWYAEEPLYDYNNPGFSMATGHFTQVVWKSTTQIGCGCKTGCTSPSPYCACVCQYNPPGNVFGQFAENVLPPSTTPVPGAPSLSSPANGATVSTTSITFSWTTPTGSPTQYQLQVSTSSSFSSTVYDSSAITDTSWTLSGFPNTGTTYYWRVRAYNSSGWGPWSGTRSFINGSSTSVPGAPSLSSPANGATVSTTSITFSWTTPTGSPTQYQLQVSTSSSFSSTLYDSSTITVTSWTLSGFPNTGTTYYWRVRAYNSSGWGPWSGTSSFVNGTVPAAPTLVSPANHAVLSDPSVTFTWNACAYATKYWLAVSTSSTFAEDTRLYYGNVGNVTAYTLKLPEDGKTYYWMVTAGNNAGWGPWSYYRTLTAPDDFPWILFYPAMIGH
ncbi:CAP domain-containing protein [Desulfoferrobacter suflitae]|uniref:CAP family protein n=1 Tax=Desulfoferrobacter suflitae TaxID=2865782 RepID=UPI0021647E94|nr:CAP domain-containing protein [Desulfoferrobacter suflitae]MCK8604329.1 CAP domain-containing protein [Desulfoferrobacter suflitae]